MVINLSTNNEILDWAKLEAFADYNVAKLMISVIIKVGKIVGKEKNAGYQYFLFQQCLHNASFPELFKPEIVCSRVNM